MTGGTGAMVVILFESNRIFPPPARTEGIHPFRKPVVPNQKSSPARSCFLITGPVG
jgi:hypothetical protein